MPRQGAHCIRSGCTVGAPRIVTALVELGVGGIMSDELVLLRHVFDERAVEP
jgi:hypothetical protein